MTAFLSAECVKCGYQNNPDILSDFDFRLERGEFVGLVGPNGAGKTTVFRALSGYLPLSSGTVRIASARICDLKAYERSKLMAVVPQNVFSPLPYMVRQIVEMGRVSRLSKFSIPSKEDRQCIQDAMEKMDVIQYADKLFNELSGGEKQRVMIAMALAQEPEILLLDEPTSQLDIGHSSHLMKLLTGLNRNAGIAVLLISHDIQLAARYCSRLVFLKNGRITADGSVKSILKPDLIGDVFGCDVEIVKDSHSGHWLLLPN